LEKLALKDIIVPEINTFEDTAKEIEKLNLVITVDTAIAHLAGAMGKQVWLLLPFAPDWRWLTKREDSPWYPSMRIFRQPKIGDWQYVMNYVTSELDSYVLENQTR
jgi:ADP-heptose:LPS heptosyltransferase